MAVPHRTVPLAALLLACGSHAVAQQTPAEQIVQARSTLEQWVDTRRLISQEKRDWALGKEMLAQRLAVVRREIATLREGIAAQRQSAGEVDQKRAQLTTAVAAATTATAGLQATVQPLEQRTLDLLARVPDHLRDKVKPLSQLIQPQADAGKQSLGERFRNVVGIVNELDKFHRDVSATSEVKSLADGTTAEVTALYIGLGQGYYVNAAGNIAGNGTLTNDRWIWTPANEAAGDITRALKVLKNETVAAFVQLPIRIQ